MNELRYICNKCNKIYNKSNLYFDIGIQYDTMDMCLDCKRKKFLYTIGIEKRYHDINYSYLNNECEIKRKKTTLKVVSDHFIDNIYEMIKEGRGLLFCGAMGTYKTYTISYIAQKIFGLNLINSDLDIHKRKRAIKVKYFSVSGLLQRFHDNRYQIESILSRNNLILLDDFGIYINEMTGSHFDEITDILYSKKISTIINTNLTPSELKNYKYCQRSIDRWNEMLISVIIKLEGFRGK